MAFIPCPDCASAAIKFDVNGQLCYNVLNFIRLSGYDQDNINELADAVDGWVGASYLAGVTSEVAYVETYVRGLSAATDLTALANANAGAGDLGTTEALPANVTWAVKFSTGLTGRSNRGRAYWIGLPVSALDANENFVAVASADAIIALWEALPTALAASQWDHVVLSKFTNGSPRTAGVARKVTAYSYVDRKIDTLGRRIR